ncbi:MAG TPA: MFS transporter [Candidatus Saccharimonadia bacterium]|jgi:EmrB/QacA subfamily drug resistance transporter
MPSHPSKNTVLWLLALSFFLVILDSAIVNVALPAIKTALHFNSATLQWVITGYILTFGGFLMLGGRTADLYGRRRILLLGIAGFILFSLLTGLSTNAPMMIAMRALQGLAGAFMAPTALSILLATFEEGPERNRALSIWSIVASGGAAAGVLLGGLLTQTLGWRWCFFVNVPIGILAIIALDRTLPPHIAESSDHNLDAPGAVLVTLGLIALVFGLTSASGSGWTAVSTLTAFASAIILLVAFVFNESRVTHPLMPLGIFKTPNIAAANLMMLPAVAGALGMFYFASLFIQNVLRSTPLTTGLYFLPVPVIIGVVSYQAPKLLTRFGSRPLLISGTALTTLGVYLMSLINAGSAYFTAILPVFTLLALGFGVLFVAIVIAATTGIPDDEAGLASGLINTSQQIGGALGLAILAEVASSTTVSAAAHGASLQAASVLGYQRAFLTGAILMALALVVAIFIIREPVKPAPGIRSVGL